MDFFAVDGPWPGRLAVVSRPRSGPWLEDDARQLQRNGVGLLVSALTAGETVRAGLATMARLCGEHGVDLEHFPVGNMTVPPLEATLAAVERWQARLAAGDGLAIHCWAGVGRSPTLAAALLAWGGVDADEAWGRIEVARGRQVPDTHDQRAFVRLVAQHVGVSG